MAAAEAYGKAEADSIIGLGGGSAMDVAKSAAAVVSNGGHIRDYEEGVRPCVNPHPPLMFIPTTSGTGSEAVGGTIIIDTSRQFKMHIVAVPGHVALCDPLLTLSLPPAVTAATGLDALSHAIGAYVSVERQPLADAYALYAIELIRKWLPRAIADGQRPRGAGLDDGGEPDRRHLDEGRRQRRARLRPRRQRAAPGPPRRRLRRLPGRRHGLQPRPTRPTATRASPRRWGSSGARRATSSWGGRASPRCARWSATPASPTLNGLGVDEPHVAPLVDYVMQDAFHLGLNPVPITPPDAERILRTTLAG